MDALIMLLALVCAPPMLYNVWAGRQRRQGHEVPEFRELLATGWAHAAPVLEVVGYLCKRALAHQWRPTEDEKPALLRSTVTDAYVYDDEGDPGADEQTDRQTDLGVFPLRDAIQSKMLDRTRAALIEELVTGGWGAGMVRSLLKGDTGAIGAEVEAAKQRLGVTDAPRVVKVSERIDGKTITREVTL